MIWDTHAHLDDKDFNADRDKVIARAREQGISNIVNIGYSEASSQRAVALAAKFPFIYAAVGIIS